MTAFYNEIDPYAAAWLRNLITAGLIAPGVVDERDIRDIEPDELRGYVQCHFFAGIGVWSHALRLAGWPDGRPVWTGSCPCQPFSAAGKGKGHEDERHLWPAWQRLIRERRPAAVLGEQVASADGLGWLDVVLSDLEAADYAVAAADLSAAGFGAPHIRQRLFFVAHAGRECGQPDRFDLGSAPRGDEAEARERERLRADAGAGGLAGLMADADGGLVCEAGDGGLAGLQRSGQYGLQPQGRGARGLADHDRAGQREQRSGGLLDSERPTRGHDADGCGALRELGDAERGGLRVSRRAAADEPHESGFWSLCDWIDCRDGKRRPVEPGTFPLAHGATARVGRLRAYGNAIVAPVAAEFIGAAMTPAERNSEGPSLQPEAARRDETEKSSEGPGLLPGDPGQDEQGESQ